MRAHEPPALLRYSLIVPRRDICYVSWTIDAYEGIGTLRTDDGDSGLVSVLFSMDYREELESLLDALESEGVHLERLGIYDDELS